MLALTRKVQEHFTIEIVDIDSLKNGDKIEIHLVEIHPQRSSAKIGIEAPMAFEISRPDAKKGSRR